MDSGVCEHAEVGRLPLSKAPMTECGDPPVLPHSFLQLLFFLGSDQKDDQSALRRRRLDNLGVATLSGSGGRSSAEGRF